MRTPKGTLKGSRDLRSLLVALLVMRNDTFCTTTLVRKKAWERAEHTSGHVTSGSTTANMA